MRPWKRPYGNNDKAHGVRGMGPPLLEELEDELRKGFLIYSRKAFDIIPSMGSPRILDIACGSGVLTVELARISGGTVLGIDIDRPKLARLKQRAEDAGLGDRITTKACSMDDMGLEDGSFDIIWCEGGTQFIGFERGLTDWKRLLRPGGHLVIHTDIKDYDARRAHIVKSGYELVSHFPLPEDAWWVDYFQPLGERLPDLYKVYKDDTEALKALDAKKLEMVSFKKDIRANRSVFFIMQRME
jgi:ubiquinone/menaquinone biosynthesis C-methylase UbiE